MCRPWWRSGIGIGRRHLILFLRWFFDRVLLLYFPQILADGVMDLGCLRQLFSRNLAALASTKLPSTERCFPSAFLHLDTTLEVLTLLWPRRNISRSDFLCRACPHVVNSLA
jgi:hypothetical protein